MSAVSGIAESMRLAVPQAREREEFCRDLARIRLRIYRDQTATRTQQRTQQQKPAEQERPLDGDA